MFTRLMLPRLAVGAAALSLALFAAAGCKPKTKTDSTPAESPRTAAAPAHVDPFPSPDGAEEPAAQPEVELPIAGGMTNKELLAKLEEAREKASPDERKFIEHQLELVKNFNPRSMNEEMLQNVVEQSVLLMEDYGEMYPDNFDIQLDLASAMFLAGYTTPNAGIDGAKYRDKGKEMSIKLAERFPDRASAHANLGYVYFRLDEQDNSVKSFNKCIELEPENKFCRAYLEEIKKRREEAETPAAGKNTTK